MRRKNWGLLGAAAAMLILILDSRAAVQAAAEGLEACIRTVIPSLFPFFLLSGYLTGSLGSGILPGTVARIFHTPPNSGGILLAGLLGGYPVGAKLAAEGFRSGKLTKDQTDRLLMFCSQAGPSFLFGIAAAQFNDMRSGWALWAIQLLSAWSVSQLVPKMEQSNPAADPAHSIRWSDAMQSSITAMASVCGWILIFSVVNRFLSRWLLWLFPAWIQILICGLLELTNGCLMLSSLENIQLRFLLAAVMLNFGGLCVWMQTASVAHDLDMGRYLLGKALQTGFSLLYTLIWMGYPLALFPLFVPFTYKFLATFRKRGSIPSRIGV